MPSRNSLIAAVVLVSACTGGRVPLDSASLAYGHYGATGIASWYGGEAGARTASGERFDPGGLTVAHRTLPFGSLVEVTSLDTGRAIVARVNDRGPHRPDRLIDLSRGAARLLGTDRRPSQVRVRSIQQGERTHVGLSRAGSGGARVADRPSDDRYMLRVATFGDIGRAQALADRLGGAVVASGPLYRVEIGPFASVQSAQRARDAMAARGYADGYLSPAP